MKLKKQTNKQKNKQKHQQTNKQKNYGYVTTLRMIL